MFRRSSLNKKTLHNKLAAVNDLPGSDVFDLSDCGINKIPDGVFEKCKLLHKKALNLSHNCLEELKGGGDCKNLSHLLILDLSNNVMTKLNKSIHLLASLQKLDLSHNKFKELPESIGKLVSLKVLLLTDNLLTSLPQSIKSLQQLEELDVSQNKWITSLPVNLCYLRALKVFNFDFERVNYPPKEITARGIFEIRRWFTELKGDQYDFEVCDGYNLNESFANSSINYSPSKRNTLPTISHQEDQFEEFIRQRELNREMHSKGLLLKEKETADKQSALAMSVLDTQDTRHKELVEVAKGEMSNNQVLMKNLENEEQRHKKMVQLLQNEEISSTLDLITKISERDRKTDALLEDLDREQYRIDSLVKNEESKYLRKEEIIKKMSAVLQEMTDSENKWNQFEYSREDEWKKSLKFVVENSPDVDSVLEEKDRTHQKLIMSLLSEQENQMKAFEILQSQKDAMLNRIHMQLAMVQNELARLSMLELSKREEQNKNETNKLCEMRINTASLLAQLLKDRDNREEAIKQSIREMDLKRDKNIQDYWFIQFQRLVDRRNFESNYMAIINSSRPEPQINENKCENDSIVNQDVSKPHTVEENLCKEQDINAQWNEDNDILQHEYNKSCNSNFYKELECVVCMDVMPEIIFLPCGHLCCCAKCCSGMSTCPLCRKEIANTSFMSVTSGRSC
ncbi:E3 ubiquitin-protein ligase LRSAM1 isoform X1 [Hydra vulgaris]|uniref:E3 ubiquitin-protein ligase LRSAM1 isoform X1 n=1 Tax=Hydra vulgaris TaxID=6087 RepID=UPI001F5F20F6|nr:E3 ubiquitin-protein ligase LRSAM1 isoform X1 [Hydra vulgaris]